MLLYGKREKRGLILERTALFILGLGFIAISIRHNAKGHEKEGVGSSELHLLGFNRISI